MKWHYDKSIVDASSLAPSGTAIVFGAAVYRNGRLSPVLRDRMETAIQLYEAGLVRSIVVSGDGRRDRYDESGAMRDYAIARGVSPDTVQVDDAGLRTYDTCYRARRHFDIETAVLVTQAFHLPRALFTCDRLGLQVFGVATDMRTYRAARWYEFRETVAGMIALLDVVRRRPPTLLGLHQSIYEVVE